MLNIQKVRYGQGEGTFTSRDKSLFFEIDDDVFNEVADEEECHEVHNIDGKLVRCSYEFKPMSKYEIDAKNIDLTQQEYLETLYNKHFKLCQEEVYDARKDNGYINYTKDYDSMKPEDYYGLLEKYFTQGTLKYLEGGAVFGYLGHEERTLETDKVICEFLDENLDMKERVNTYFLTNSAGRHYMGNYSGPEDLRKFLAEL